MSLIFCSSVVVQVALDRSVRQQGMWVTRGQADPIRPVPGRPLRLSCPSCQEMATPAERFGLLAITVDAASIPVDAEDDRRGQWILRRVASNGVMSLDNQLFSMTKETGHDRDHACRRAGCPGPARGTSDPRAAGPGAAPRLGAHPGQGVWDQSL